MATKTQRKLTAILCADVVGYSRLMGADEEATIETLTAYRKVFTSKTKRHRGRVVDAKGDAILAEFASVVDAVNGAVEIQRELAEKNTSLTDDRRMDFRIGVNLGDVVVKDDAIYGDGVNIAARLESLAEPGGICISRPVHDQVKSKLKLDYEFLGEQEVKNIAEPVRAYRIRTTNKAESDVKEITSKAASAMRDTVRPFVEGQTLPLPDKPSVAVLAFENMSGDPEQEYFSDGLAEDIITDLTKLTGLFVIARNSSFTYKGRSVTVQQVGEEMGVRYVLEGSVRKAGNRVRITAQLVEAASGEHLWAERFDRELEDMFAVQDEITGEIVTALDVKLVKGEQARYVQKSLKNPHARECFYRGLEQIQTISQDSFVQARRRFEEVIQLEPDSPIGYTWVGMTHWYDVMYGWSDDPEYSIENGAEFARKALAQDEEYGQAHNLLGLALVWNRQFDEAVAAGERAIFFSPNDAYVANSFGYILVLCENAQEAIAMLKRAMRLSPVYPAPYISQLGAAYAQLRNGEKAIALLKEALTIEPNYVSAHVGLASIYVWLGRDDEARAEAEQILSINPRFSVMKFLKNQPYRSPKFMEIVASRMHHLGLN